MTKATQEMPSRLLQEDLMKDVYYRLAQSYIDELYEKGILTASETQQLQAQNRSVYQPFLHQLMD